MASAAAVYFRLKASKDAKGNWQADPTGGWRFLAVPGTAGRPPEWLKAAKKSGATNGRGFQFRLSDGNWSRQFPTIEAARDAAEAAPHERLAAQRGLTLAENAKSSNANRTTIKSAIDNFLDDKSIKTPKTVGKYTYVLNEFADQLPRQVKFIDEIDKDVLKAFDRFLEGRGAAPKTINDKILIVCFLLKSCGVENSSKMHTARTVQEEEVLTYSAQELKALFAAMDAEDKIRYTFFLGSACREMEVATAQWRDISKEKGKFTVRSKEWTGANGLQKSFTPKSHQSRDIPLPQELLKMLAERQKTSHSVWIFPNEEDQPEGHFLRKFKRIAFAAGLNCGQCDAARTSDQHGKSKAAKTCATNRDACDAHYLHRLRKTRATQWLESGVPVRSIQKWLGHKSLETTMLYLGETDSVKLQTEINQPMY
jgi:integrase